MAPARTTVSTPCWPEPTIDVLRWFHLLTAKTQTPRTGRWEPGTSAALQKPLDFSTQAQVGNASIHSFAVFDKEVIDITVWQLGAVFTLRITVYANVFCDEFFLEQRANLQLISLSYNN